MLLTLKINLYTSCFTIFPYVLYILRHLQNKIFICILCILPSLLPSSLVWLSLPSSSPDLGNLKAIHQVRALYEGREWAISWYVGIPYSVFTTTGFHSFGSSHNLRSSLETELMRSTNNISCRAEIYNTCSHVKRMSRELQNWIEL